ncbi:E3 ubiquitin-protein ligase TRIM32-like [Branchiostoma floridae x Branchiostoma japonicum]
MAAAPSSLGEQISEELTCSICLELFTRPKVLPCQHTFCQDCLQDLVGKNKHLKCPNCRKHIWLPRKGVAGFRDNHLVTSLCERLQNQATLSGETREHVQPQSGNRCSFHPSEEAKLYCKQCQSPVCEECLEEMHDGHGTTTIKKALQESKTTVQALLSEGRNILESYGLIQEEKRLNEQKQRRDNSIIDAYDQMVQKLTERRDQLLSESQQNHRENLKKIEEERDRRSADVNKLSAACDQAEQELEKDSLDIDFFCQETILAEMVENHRGQHTPTPVQPQFAAFQPTDTPVPVLGHVTVVGSVSSAPVPAAPAPIPSVPNFGNVVARGKGHDYCNKKHWPERVIFGRSRTQEFDYPCGVTVSDEGEIFVADWGNQTIQVFTLHGTFVRQFPTVMSGRQKMKPYSIATDGEGYLWVVGFTKSAEFAVQYNKQGKVLIQRKIGMKSTSWHRGVAVDTKRYHILITQTTGVQVFRPDGTYVRTVSLEQQMKHPSQFMNITVDRNGRILVSVWNEHYVYVYNNDGQFLFQFGSMGSHVGQLKYPHGICTDRSGNIIVADCGNSRVEMFDKRGRFLKHIATEMAGPLAVAMAPQGQLVVTDEKNAVTIFSNFLSEAWKL